MSGRRAPHWACFTVPRRAVHACKDLKLTKGTPLTPNIAISKQSRTDAIASLKRYFRENMPEPVGDLAAGLLLDFFLEEFGPVIYNQAISDAQKRMAEVVSELSGDLYVDEFQYWPKEDRKRRDRTRS